MNVVVVRGTLSRPPEVRTLPSGEELVAYEVTVRRAGRPAEGIPVVRFGAALGGLASGDEVVAVGRVRRRFFRAGGVTQSRTEVVAEAIVPAANRRRVRTALAKASLALEDGAKAT